MVTLPYLIKGLHRLSVTLTSLANISSGKNPSKESIYHYKLAFRNMVFEESTALKA